MEALYPPVVSAISSARETFRQHALCLDVRLPFAAHRLPEEAWALSTPFRRSTLAAYNELLPGHGVYVTTLRIADELFEGVTNIGTRPTFGEDSFTVETHLLNFHPVVLEERTPLELTFLLYLRAEQRWPDSETLRSQIMKDVARARRYFALSDSLTSAAPDIST